MDNTLIFLMRPRNLQEHPRMDPVLCSTEPPLPCAREGKPMFHVLWGMSEVGGRRGRHAPNLPINPGVSTLVT